MDLHVNGGEEGSEVILSLGMPTAAAAPAQNGRSGPGATYPDVLVEPLLISSAHPAATWNGAAYPGVLVEPPLISSAHPAATWNGAAYTDWLAAHLFSSGGPPHRQAVHDGAPHPGTDGLIMAQLRSGAARTAPWNAVVCPDVLTARLAPDVSPAAWNDVAYPGVATALDTSALSFVPPQGAAEADLGSERLRSTGTAAAATERSGGYCHYHHSGDMALPFAAQVVVVDEAEDSDSLVEYPAVALQDEDEAAAGAVAGPVPVRGGVGGQLGAAAVTLAVAGLTAGGEVNPWTAVPLFLMLIAGVTMVTARVVRG